MRSFILLFFCLNLLDTAAQHPVQSRVADAGSGEPLAGAHVVNTDGSRQTLTGRDGRFRLELPALDDSIRVSAVGYHTQAWAVRAGLPAVLLLQPAQREIDAVVVSGTLRPMSKLESPVPVEVYTPQFFKKNPAPSIFESLQQVNGVRPQLNCSVCNTGDIHINGLEGPYTMITIDGMPIVSSLASVYGLFGIPTQLIDRVEIVKGPASGLYGAEAIGGLINIITKSPEKAPLLSGNLMMTSWQEKNLDVGIKLKPGRKTNYLLGLDYYHYGQRIDKNKDGFTDVALQHRISVFQKLSWQRKEGRKASLAARYFYEDRWGGETNWSKQFRGGDSLYGESIYTNRWELIGQYQLPVKESVNLSFSATHHNQNSFYGIIPYKGTQNIGFAQLVWDRNLGNSHSLLAGAALRYNWYDDNSTATVDTSSGRNRPERYWLPGLFVQDEWKINEAHRLLTGIRIDHHPAHGLITTPRIAWKWQLAPREVLRVNAGTGFRVVSLFTEDHAALTGARAVEIREELKPEQSYNINLNYTRSWQLNRAVFQVDASAWYSHFTNQILADYDTDPQKIIYQNIDGYASSKGFTLNLELSSGHRFKGMAGATLQRVMKHSRLQQGGWEHQRPVLTENWSGNWTLSYSFPAIGLTVDYTGNIYGTMRLPLISAQDPRAPYSPVWSIQNIQFSKRMVTGFELFAGIKNLLNWTPARSTPFLIARSHDPFDKQVQYDAAGQVLATPDNPYALSFDPSYVYAPNQGLRVFAGLRWQIKP